MKSAFHLLAVSWMMIGAQRYARLRWKAGWLYDSPSGLQGCGVAGVDDGVRVAVGAGGVAGDVGGGRVGGVAVAIAGVGDHGGVGAGGSVLVGGRGAVAVCVGTGVEVADGVAGGASIRHEESQPSPEMRLWSSHSSRIGSRMPLPQVDGRHSKIS